MSEKKIEVNVYYGKEDFEKILMKTLNEKLKCFSLIGKEKEGSMQQPEEVKNE